MPKPRLRFLPCAALGALLALSPVATASAAASARPTAPPPPADEGFGPHACAASQWPWNCLAECESGGDWKADTGNGFYGGLQFKPSTWKEHGGLEHAPRADLASRAEQIEVAESVVAAQGWGAWPDCSKRYGLADQRVHIVKEGETLSSIAAKHKVKGGWKALYEANKDMVGPRPDRLNVGTWLVLPEDSGRGRAPAQHVSLPTLLR